MSDQEQKPAQRQDLTGVKLALSPEETAIAKRYKQQNGSWPTTLLTPDGDFRVVMEYAELKKIQLAPLEDTP